ncbi:Putative bacteriophage protein [Salmonella enterica subsp. enterica serovar Senftenberg str. A4-543]|uniref:Putative bacteriophage protein n=1 Tax=Salmonella enterica subsp. enterica serovar Senftenberg str. A4-543 TaxID=913082 RepID=G5QXS6_SALSE|nr:Putative bacteriophage protein [Salmonella enterica subsp. enterica serovar Senftenberg str. A4-543]
MRIITRKKPAFTDLYQTGVLTRIAAVKTDTGGWRLAPVWSMARSGCCGVCRSGAWRYPGMVRLELSCGICVQLWH